MGQLIKLEGAGIFIAQGVLDGDFRALTGTEGRGDGELSDREFDTAPVDQNSAEDDRVDRLLLDVDGFEGPLDVLLELARDQKVDLLHVKILALAEQYLAFIHRADRLKLELAGDYLVMAAWLAYLKSRLLLPKHEQPQDEPGPEELAEALAFQLKRLEAMREAGAKLLQQPRLNIDVYPRGLGDTVGRVVTSVYDTGLADLLKAYAGIMLADSNKTMEIQAFDLYAMDDAIQRLRQVFGAKFVPNWTDIACFLPTDLTSPLKRRSAFAAHFVGSLEMCRDGELEIRQEHPFAPILLRSSQAQGEIDIL